MNPARILVGTPVDGAPTSAHVTWGYHHKVRQLERSGAVVIPSDMSWSDDLVRARSRMVFYALHRNPNPWDWFLWWDDDVVPSDTTMVARMIARADADGHLVIGAPYPRKRIPVNFPYKPLDIDMQVGSSVRVVNDCAEVEYLAIGFMLTHRTVLERMEREYADEWWLDIHDRADPHETVAMFRQVMTPSREIPDGKGGTTRYRELLSEDYSFCWRWRAMGGKVQMYVGEGAPVAHVGGHVFQGDRAELGQVL